MTTYTADAALVKEYLDWLAQRRTAVTAYNYAGILSSWLDWITPCPLGAVDAPTIEGWLQRPRGGRAKGAVGSAATQSKNLAALRSLYRYLHTRGHLQADPTQLVEAPTIKNRQPRAISDQLWLSLWNDPHLDLEDRVALGLGFYVGLRRREIVSLAPHHFLEGQIVGFTRKGGGDDITPYSDVLDVLDAALPHLQASTLKPAIAELCELRDSEPFLFSWGETRHNDPAPSGASVSARPAIAAAHNLAVGEPSPDFLNRRLKWLCERADVAKVTPHQLRHSACTNLLRAGVQLHLVANLMNHANVQTTMRYVKAGGGELREWLAQSALRRRDESQ